MTKKYTIAITITTSILLLLIATMVYPGGSRFDKNTIGFYWTKNYISNLFGAKAVNGAPNPARVWADFAMLFLAMSFGFFYYDFSERIASNGAKQVIKYAGIGSVLFAFLVITPYHDIMVTISDIFSMLSIFYITVFVFKTKLNFHKFLCCLCLVSLYFLTYIYYSGNLMHMLAIMQKIDLAISIVWMLSLQYFVPTGSFEGEVTLTKP